MPETVKVDYHARYAGNTLSTRGGDRVLQPENDSWAAVVYDSIGTSAERLGTAVVIDSFRLLTCRHVAADGDTVRDRVWVAFPKAAGPAQRRRWAATVDKTDPDLDVALLRLVEVVPPGVAAAPLRCPAPRALVDKGWWAFGFADSRRGNGAYGTVGESLGDGYVRIDAEQSTPYRLKPGFSGGGVWSPEFDAVVGMVVSADEHGNGEAITVQQVDLCFPEEGLRELTRWTAADAGDVALSAWSLRSDPEGTRHWGPRARGVAIDSERGFRFRGRTAALSSIVHWLDRGEPDRRALVVTGSPGVGKSAVLGRIVTTADALIRAQLPADDGGVLASEGSVACAVHVKGKTALEVAAEIARAASAELPSRPEDLAPAVREVLARLEGRRRSFNIVLDAVDEATSPAETRSIVTGIVLPLVETCADVGTQVVVGIRRQDDDGDLLRLFGAALATVDLDDPRFFEQADLESYALATLQLAGDERPGNPYAVASVARPMARRIATLSEGNFLIAGLVARTHGLHDPDAADPARLVFTATVDAALGAYLQRLAPVADMSADILLTALAFAESPGLPLGLWRVAVSAIAGRAITTQELARFARSSAANFLVESSGDGIADSAPAFRLFHRALNDALLAARSQIAPAVDDERALTRAFITSGRETTWGSAPGYLLRSLPAHASRAGLIDDLLADSEYLLHVDLRQLIPLTIHAGSPTGRRRASLLRLTPQAITASAQARIPLFSVTEVLEDIGRDYTSWPQRTPFRAIWASTVPRAEHAVLEGHARNVHAVCAFTLGRRALLASASDDTTIRVWDAASGHNELTLRGHTAPVYGICAFTCGDQILLASGSSDDTVRIWDPAIGEHQRTLVGHSDAVSSVCAFTDHDQMLLASAGFDDTVRIWDPATGEHQRTLSGHASFVTEICAATVGGRPLLASASNDGTVRIWDPATGEHQRTFTGHTEKVVSLCAFTHGNGVLLASAGLDYTVRIWDPLTGQQLHALDSGSELVNGICAFASGNRTRLATAASGGQISIWDPGTGEHERSLYGQTAWLNGICAFVLGEQVLLASAAEDDTVRIWDLNPASQTRSLARGDYIVNEVSALCTFPLGTHMRLASSSRTTLRIWDPATGQPQRTLTGHSGWVSGVTQFTMGDRVLLASASYDGTVRIWDPATGEQQGVLHGHTGWVHDICAFVLGSRVVLASTGQDGTVRIWDSATGNQQRTLEGHRNSVDSVCAISTGNQILLASGGYDHTVRIWNPTTGKQLHGLQGHQEGITALTAFNLNGQVLLASASLDATIRIWEPGAGIHLRTLTGHTHPINGLCAFTLNGRVLMATASDDRTARIWDLVSGSCHLVIPVQHQANAVAWVAEAETLAVGLSAGLLALRVDLSYAASNPRLDQ